MASVVVTARPVLNTVEIATCSMCSIEFVIPAEDVEMFRHEETHHGGDSFCSSHFEESPYILGVRPWPF